MHIHANRMQLFSVFVTKLVYSIYIHIRNKLLVVGAATVFLIKPRDALHIIDNNVIVVLHQTNQFSQIKISFAID